MSPANDAAGDFESRPVNDSEPLETDAQSAKAAQAAQRAFDHPRAPPPGALPCGWLLRAIQLVMPTTAGSRPAIHLAVPLLHLDKRGNSSQVNAWANAHSSIRFAVARHRLTIFADGWIEHR